MRKTKVFIGTLIILFFQLSFGQIAHGQEASSLNQEDLTLKLKRGILFLFGIERRLESTENAHIDIKQSVKSIKKRLTENEEKIKSLSQQLENIKQQRKEAQQKVKAITLQRAIRENEINVLEGEIDDMERELVSRREELDDYLNALTLQANTFYSPNFENANPLSFLLAKGSISDVLQQQEYLVFMQSAGTELTDQLSLQAKQLSEKKERLYEKKADLDFLMERLAAESRNMEAALSSRERLLEQTKGRQLIYEQLLEESQREQEEITQHIESLKENYGFFEKKIEELKQSAGDALPFSLENYELSLRENLFTEEKPLEWPVSPRYGITAFFHDEAYKKSIGIPHNAIDIRVSQGSPVRAAADAVVYKAVDSDLAYSYVILAHADGFLTLYGHLSEVYVEENDIVRVGETIGLSGGMPGTKGAGWLTTGPHLHFEVFKNWKHVDPLEHMPLEFVSIEFLPEKYVKLIEEGSAKKVRREEKIKRF